jgi:hypothetical protein
LRENKPDMPRTLFWRQQRGDQIWRGVREGDWKLVVRQQGSERTQWLFDLAKDIGEKNDLQASRPADFQRLQVLLAKWEEEVKPSR